MSAAGRRREMKFICFVLTMFKSNDCSGSKSIVSVFVLFLDMLHEDLVFQSGARGGVGRLFPPQSLQCSTLLLPLSLRCHGFTRMCMSMWGVSLVRISGTPHSRKKLTFCIPFCQVWHNTVHFQQEGLYMNASLLTSLLHVQEWLLLSYWLTYCCSLTCSNKVPKKIKTWWVNPSFTSSDLIHSAYQWQLNLMHSFKSRFKARGCNLKIGSKCNYIRSTKDEAKVTRNELIPNIRSSKEL